MLWPKKFWVFLSLSLLALLGSGSIIVLTSRSGFRMDFDSLSYIALARHVLDPSSQFFSLPESHYPPFFTFVLVFFSRLGGVDPAEVCRYLQACFFGLNIFLVGMLLAKYTQSALISIGGAGAFLISDSILLRHLKALSEPMFICLMLLWLLFFIDFIESTRKSSFILCVMTLVIACLTRWTGGALVLASIVGILLFKKENVKTRCMYVGVLISASLLPLLLWMAKNAVLTGRAIDWFFIFNPHTVADYNVFNKFVFLDSRNILFPGAEGLILIVVIFFIGMVIWSKRDRGFFSQIPDGAVIFTGILFYFSLIYYIVLILTMTFFDNAPKIYYRYLLPLHISWILAGGLFLYILLESNKKNNFLKFVFVVLCLLVGVANSFDTIQAALQRYSSIAGFDGIHGDDGKLIAEVKNIPSDKIVYTNSSNAIYSFVKRDSLEIMPQYEMANRPNPAYAIFMERMKDDLRAHKAVLVYFVLQDPKLYASLEGIKKAIALKTIARSLNGAIYGWDDNKKGAK